MTTTLSFSARLGGLNKWARTLALGLAAGLGLAPLAAQAQLTLDSTTPKTENFDGLGTSATATLPTGFVLATGTTGISYANAANTAATTRSGGTSGTGALASNSAGGAYNFANGVTATATDRALGFLASGSYTVPRHILLAVQNNTGAAISDLGLSYDIEKYRTGTNAFEWQLWTSADGSTWTQVTAATQAYPADAANAVVNPATTITKTATLAGLNLAAGATTYLRWTYTGAASTNSQGLGLDNLTLTPTAGGTTTPPAAPTIATGSVSPTSFCVTSAAGSTAFSVPFTTTGTLSGTYSVQLSDASGAFAATTGSIIGTGSASPVSATIPAGTASGSKYRVRVLNSSPATTGTDNGQDLTVSLTATSNAVTVTPGDAQSVTTTGTGSTLTASAALSGSTYTFQYGTSASGPFSTSLATGSSYQVKGSDFAGAGTYYVVAQATATTSCGSVVGTSSPVTVTVTAPPATPVVTVSATSLPDFGSVAVGAGSLLKSFTVSGTGLTGPLTITPPAGFEIRTDGTAFACCAITLTPSGGSVPSTTVEVRFVPTASQAYQAAITVEGSGQPTQAVAVAGTGVDAVYPATLSTAPITDLATTSATSGGTIASDGGSAVTVRGVVYGKSANPTIALTTKTSDGTGSGTFSSAITGLTPGTTYFARAYATSGVGTTYGDELSFTTVAVPLADEPANPATVAAGTVTGTSIQLLLGGGPSQKYLVLAHLSAAVDAIPTDATTYTANAAFGTGQVIGTGNYVVAAGSDQQVTVTGLRPNTSYSFSVFAYNDNNTPYAENYLTTNPGTLTQSTQAAPAALLLEENFEYPAGDLLTAHNWTAHSGAGTNSVKVVAANLSLAGYGPNSGNAAALTGNGEDVSRQFAPVYARTPAYASFLVKVNSASTTAEYFLHLGPQSLGSTFRARVSLRKDATTGKVQFGITGGTGAAVYTTGSYDLGTTYLLVVKYVFDESGNTSQLFVNPGTDTEPATADATETETGTSPAAPNDNIGTVALRQGTNSPNLVLDGLRIGNTYRVVKTGLTCQTPAPAFMAAPVCQGTPTTFADASTQLDGNATYAWDVNGDGTVDFTTAGNLSYIYPAAGTYTATLTITQGTCSASYAQQVTVRALPTVALSGSTTVCAGTSATLQVHLTGTAPWQVAYSADGGQTATTLAVSAADLNADGNYALTVQPSATTTYSLTAVSDANCTGATPSGTAVVTVNALPTAAISGTSAVCAGSSATLTIHLTGVAPWSVAYSADGGKTNTTLTVKATDVNAQGNYALVVTPAATTTYSLTAVSDANCTGATPSGAATVTVNPLPTAALSGSATVCAGSSAALIVHLTGTAPFTLSYSAGGQVASTVTVKASEVNASGNYALAVMPSATTTYSLTAVADVSCPGTTPSGSATVTVNTAPVLTVPAAITASTQAGQRGATVAFAATATGTAPTITYSAVLSGATTAITSPYLFPVGTTVVTATAANSCGTVSQSFTVTVQNPTLLSVLYQNPDYLPLDNVIRPNLQLVNNTAAAIPYQQLTVRYWLTVEDFAAVQATVDYAQLGTSGVKARYVALAQPAQGAFGYVEYSFTATGSLAAGGNSGVIQSRIYKQDYTLFNEADDYSYGPTRSYAKTDRITVYRSGVLVGGIEPALVPAVQQLQAWTQNILFVPYTNTLSLFEQVRNVGNVPVAYQDLTVRYWFTPDGTPALKAAVDYAQLGNNNVSVTFGKAGTETFAELHFAAGLGSLAPLSTTGTLNYRVYKSDYSFFNQANDYSYRGPLLLPTENQRVTIYQQGQLVYGQEPAGAQGGTVSALASAADEAGLLDQSPVFEAYPNPFTERTQLHFRAATSGPARLVVYNALGQVVARLFDGTAQASQDYGFTLEAAGLSTGVYLGQLQVDGKTQTVRLTLAN